MSEANLGLATTMELIDELQARAFFSKSAGETWPLYRTKDSEGPTVIDQADNVRDAGGVVLTVHDDAED